MSKFIEKIKSLDKGTVIRSIALVIALANQVVAVFGATSFAAAPWYQITTLVVTAVTALFAGWKNNDFTDFAKLASGVLSALRDGKITVDEVKELLEKSKEE